MIPEWVDDDLKISRDYCFRNIRLSRSTIIIDCNDRVKLTIRERGKSSGTSRVVSLDNGFDYTETTQWNGSCDRPSLLDQVGVAFYSLIVVSRWLSIIHN